MMERDRRWAMLVALSLALGGCAAYTGPRVESTAYPPSPPERPTPPPRQEVQHEVRPAQTRTPADREAVTAAYAARGKPAVAVVFFDASNSIVIAPALGAVVRTTASSSASAVASSGGAAASAQRQSETVAGTGVVGTASEQQLLSWSDVQQAFFDTLRGYGIRMVDPETITLGSLDKLLLRTNQGISLHTAELERVRAATQFEVLFVVQEVGDGSDSYLQGRVWDLRDGQLLAAERKRLRFGRDSETAKVVIQSSARNLAADLIEQAVGIWAE